MFLGWSSTKIVSHDCWISIYPLWILIGGHLFIFSYRNYGLVWTKLGRRCFKDCPLQNFISPWLLIDQHIFVFSYETTKPIWTKLDRNFPWILVYQNISDDIQYSCLGSWMAETSFIFLSETTGLICFKVGKNISWMVLLQNLSFDTSRFPIWLPWPLIG